MELIRGIVRSYSTMYEQGIVHRDLKLDNILYSIKENGEIAVKIADFGLSKFQHSQMTMGVGTYAYDAPEVNVCGDEKPYYDSKVDVFSLGVIMFVLFVGQTPIECDCYRGMINRNTHLDMK